MRIMVPTFIAILTLSLITSEAYSYEGIAIEDPSIKKHCNELTYERSKKIKHRKKLEKLLRKNLRLKSRLEPRQKKAADTLQRLHDKLLFQIQVTRERVVDMGEAIIKGGCPPIDLEGQNFKRFSTKEIVKNNSKLMNIEEADEMDLQAIENF